MKPFQHFSKKILMVLELPEAAVDPLLIVRNLEEVAVKQFPHVYNEILLVVEASGSCCESFIGGSGSRGSCCESISTLLQINIYGSGNFRKLM